MKEKYKVTLANQEVTFEVGHLTIYDLIVFRAIEQLTIHLYGVPEPERTKWNVQYFIRR